MKSESIFPDFERNVSGLFFKEDQEIISAKVVQNGSFNSEKIEMFQINRHKIKIQKNCCV